MSPKNLFLVVFTFSQLASADAEDTQLWNVLNVASDFATPQWTWNVELQTRHSETQEINYQNFIRPSVGYKFESGIIGSVGVMTMLDQNTRRVEDRLWQQIYYKWSFNYLDFKVRFRQEQRSFVLGENGIAHRERLQTRFDFTRLKFADGTIMPFLSNEFLYNLNSAGTTTLANSSAIQGQWQNRLSFGLNFKISESLQLEASYLNVLSKRTTDYLKIDTMLLALNAKI